MEFTKDDYVAEGNLEVSVKCNDGKYVFDSVSKVIIKHNWIIAEGTTGVSVFNRESIQGFDIEFKEG